MALLRYLVAALLAANFALFSGTALSARESAAVETLGAMDLRVLKIGHQLATQNAHLCRETMPSLGLTMHSRDQYSRADEQTRATLFPHDSLLAVQSILPSGPADAAGIPASTVIVGFNQWTAEDAKEASGQIRLQAHAHLASLPSNQPLTLHWVSNHNQDSQIEQTQVEPIPACKVLIEVVVSEKRFARSNGPIIQISSKFVGLVDDDQLAVIIAHELAHTALEHRIHLEAANVGSGLFAEFGKSGRLKREAEIEADRVSLHLLRNAGYDPAIGPGFWRSKIGKKSSGGLFRKRYYPSAKKRAKLMDQEIETMYQAKLRG